MEFSPPIKVAKISWLLSMTKATHTVMSGKPGTQLSGSEMLVEGRICSCTLSARVSWSYRKQPFLLYIQTVDCPTR